MAHGISSTCLKKWGPRREKSLQVSRQLPAPTHGVISQEDGRRLHFLRTVSRPDAQYIADVGFFGRLTFAQGPSIDCPSLRLATLAYYDVHLPYERQDEEYMIHAVHAIAKKDVSELSEGDLFAVCLLTGTKETRRQLLALRPRQRRFRPEQIPSYSVQLRWFMAIIDHLLHKVNDGVSSYDLGLFWPYARDLLVHFAPLDYSDAIFWTFLSLCRRHLGPPDFEERVKMTKVLFQWNSLPAAPEPYHSEVQFFNIVQLHYKIAMIAFRTVASRTIDDTFGMDCPLQTALADVKKDCDSFEASQMYRIMLAELSTRPLTMSHAQYTPEAPFFLSDKVDVHHAFHYHRTTRLLMVLLLKAPTLQFAVALNEATVMAIHVVMHAHELLSTYNLWGIHLIHVVLSIVVAALVHPISQFPYGSLH